MMRVGLFIITNLAVLVVASFVMNILGVEQYLSQSGTGVNTTGLLIFCGLFGMTGALISLAMSKTMAKMSAGVKIIKEPANAEQRWLLESVEELARQAGIGMPEVGIFPAQVSNAFATGMNKNNALVAVSEGLLCNMDKRAVKAVLGHEIGHVANGDMVTMSLLQGVINTFVMFFARIFGSIIDQAVFKNQGRGRGFGYYMIVMVLEVLFGILASMITMWFSRYREFRADEAGARLTHKQDMIHALESLQREHEMPAQMPENFQAFGIRAGTKGLLSKLMASHPPLEVRIKALQEMP